MANDILGRVKKLLELSKNNNSAEEAASAASHAADLMFKYNIGETDLDVANNERVPEAIVNDVVEHDRSRKRDLWKGRLASSLGQAFGCKVYFMSEQGWKMHVVGLDSAVQTVSYMYGYMVLEIDRLAEEGWLEHKAETKQHAKTWKNSFRLGAVNTVWERLQMQIQAQKEIVVNREKVAKTTGSTAIALYKADQERVADEYAVIKERLGLRSKSYSSNSRVSQSAYQSGKIAGQNLSLGGKGKAISGSKERLTG